MTNAFLQTHLARLRQDLLALARDGADSNPLFAYGNWALDSPEFWLVEHGRMLALLDRIDFVRAMLRGQPEPPGWVPPRVTELTAPPLVGWRYLVPAVEGSGYGGLWPVTGPVHEDGEVIGFTREHLHYDLRFLSHEQLDELCGRNGKELFSRDFVGRPDEDAHAMVRTARNFEKISWVPKMCVREQPSHAIDGGQAPWLGALEDHVASARVKCGTCPHRGLPLSSLPRAPGTNVVTCPGHGLSWDLTTGELVRTAHPRRIDFTVSVGR